jgi:protein-arginine kinase activator protein McsA
MAGADEYPIVSVATATDLEFERAALLRDQIKALKDSE